MIFEFYMKKEIIKNNLKKIHLPAHFYFEILYVQNNLMDVLYLIIGEHAKR